MKLVKMNWRPTDRQLRQFGVIAMVALPLVAWIWGGTPAVIGAMATVGAALAAVGWVWPPVLKPLFVTLSLVAIPIGLVISELALILMYFGLFLPTGLIFRLIGRDALERKFDREAPTYWRPKKTPTDPASYLRQS